MIKGYFPNINYRLSEKDFETIVEENGRWVVLI